MTRLRGTVVAAVAALVMMTAGPARAQQNEAPNLTLRAEGAAEVIEKTGAPPAPEAVVAAPPQDGAEAGDAPWGFYRDRQGRVMQVSFDFGRRLWLGVGYAPRRTPSGETEISPAAFDFGVTYD